MFGRDLARAAGAGAAALAAFALAAASAGALSVRDTTPLWFDGPSGQGFADSAVRSAGLDPMFFSTPDDNWIDAGDARLDLPIEIKVDLRKVHKNPQAAGRVPSRTKPIIADSKWTVTNHTGEDLDDALLVFLVGDSRGGKKQPKPVALDGNLVEILEYSAGGVDYFYGAVALGDLTAEGPGSSVSIDVRYIVGGKLPGSRGKLFLPPLGVQALTGFTQVPEASTGGLMLIGLLGLALAGRRR
jgi:hypothetical protein